MGKESVLLGGVVVHGGVKFYRGAARAARAYVERDRSRADDYYLGEGCGVARRLIATPGTVVEMASMDGNVYEQWVAGIDLEAGKPKGRLRTDAEGLRFVEVVVNGPKTWSLAAALHPDISAALDAAQDRAAVEIVGWIAGHATTRVGPRGRQVQVPVEKVEAAVIRHHTSRAGDPHRHLHLQINARVFADGRWRGIHSVGIRDSIEAINGIGHAAALTDPRFRAVLGDHGFTIDPDTGEIRELARYVGAFSARTRQIHRNIDRYEARWRSAHPGGEPGPRQREIWDRRAWAEARPDKVVPTDGPTLVSRWNKELRELGYQDPGHPVQLAGSRPGWLDRDAAADLVVSRLGARKSAWNAADVRGGVELVVARAGVVADAAVRSELVDDIAARALGRCVRLLASPDVPEHVRSLTSPRVRDIETDIIHRLAARGARPARPARVGARGIDWVDPAQAAVVGALTGTGRLVVVEGAAGAGKTTALRAARRRLAQQGRRLLVVTPTLKAAEVAAAETGAEGHSAAWLIHQHGWRWDGDGHWARISGGAAALDAQLGSGDLLLVDEAGMLDQDTADALLTIADKANARVVFVGDPHQLPAVGRGGVLEHARTWAADNAVVTLETVHRFTDPDYAALTLRMRHGDNPAAVFDHLHRRGHLIVHASEVERTAALAEIGAGGELVLADRREHVSDLNAAIREHHQQHRGDQSKETITTTAGEVIGTGDRVATRRNNPDLQVANRQIWTVTTIDNDGSLRLRRAGREQVLPPDYAARFVELAYATTIHGAQGETVPRAHVAISETSGAAAVYVAMTRGRDHNTAHLVADSLNDARQQWIDVFNRDRPDLGPARARTRAIDDIDRYGPSLSQNRQPHAPAPHPPPTRDRRDHAIRL